jgi:hypothetical protein
VADQTKYHARPVPTPEETQARCLAIQTGWTDADRLRRLTGPAAKAPPNGLPHRTIAHTGSVIDD